jgi:hypothetical protein
MKARKTTPIIKKEGKRPLDRQLLCSFCDKGEKPAKKLIAGPGVLICDRCVTACNKIFDGLRNIELPKLLKLAALESAHPLKCSFCGKKQSPRTPHISKGAKSNICLACIDLSSEILHYELRELSKGDTDPIDLFSPKQKRAHFKSRQARTMASNNSLHPQTTPEQQILKALSLIASELSGINERLDKLEAENTD